jgi:MarR family 2-MHQ and catechol resistance regulon transcriptional repressor
MPRPPPAGREPSTRPLLDDEFPASPARDAVVAVVRGYGAVQRLMEPYFARFGLTPPQFQMLTIVNRLSTENLTQRRLARELYVSFPNVTVLLKRLERKKLIRRTPNLHDRREKFVILTPRGRSLLLRIWRVHQRQLDRVMTGLTVAEQKQLSRLLNQMIAAHRPPSARLSKKLDPEALPC